MSSIRLADSGENNDLLVLRLDPSGGIVWQKRFGGPEAGWGADMALTGGGDLLICGQSYPPTGSSDAWVLKLDPGGGVVWQKRYGGEEDDSASAIFESSDGSLWLLGSTRSFGPEPGNHAIWVLKLDGSGNILLQKAIGGVPGLVSGGALPAPDGGIFASAAGEPSDVLDGSDEADFLVFQLDASGNMVRSRTYGGSLRESMARLAATPEGGLLLTGVTDSYGDYGEGAIVKIDAAGDIVWQRSYGGPFDDSVDDAWSTADGVYLVGATMDDMFTGRKGWIMKLDAQGLISEDCPTGLGEPMAFQVWEPDLIVAETAAAAVETDIVPVDTAIVPEDEEPIDVVTQCEGG